MKKAFIVVGLGFGDEGKGTIVDYLTRKYDAKLIVRFNGGPQAMHHVVTEENIAHAFSQFGSGTFAPEVKTYLSSRVVVNPLSIEIEEDFLKEKGILNAASRLMINKNCLVATPFHRILSIMREDARERKHGSCGKGFGETVKDGKIMKDHAIYFKDLFDARATYEKLKFISRLKMDIAEQLLTERGDSCEALFLNYLKMKEMQDLSFIKELSEIYYNFAMTSGVYLADNYFNVATKYDCVVFEGAQGVLLDEKNGFFPYVTHSNTTFENAENLLLSSGYCGDIIKIGVLRPYFTKHGQGPFVSEDSELTALLPEIHNKENEWQGKMRVGWFDFVAAEYALKIAGKIDYLAITNIDRLQTLSKVKFCNSYEYTGEIADYDEFSKLFHWGRWDDRIIILSIRTDTEAAGKQNGKLAEYLKKCAPNYRSHCFLEGKTLAIMEYVNYIASELKTPLGILSFGPKASDKICFIK